MRKHLIALALMGLAAPHMQRSDPTKKARDKEKRTKADVQSRQDKNAAKRARRAARAHQ